MQDFSLFLGRFHPLVVHIPIGVLLFAFVLEIFGQLSKTNFKNAIILAYLVTGIGGAVAAFTGFLLSSSGGYDQSTLGWHKWLGISTSVYALILAVVKSRETMDRSLRSFSISHTGLLIALVFIGITGHLGGKLTHGETYLTKYMPKPLGQLFTSNNIEKDPTSWPTEIDSVNLYVHVIKPALENKCVSCHNPSKMKGGLDLTTIEGIEAGGTSGHAIESGKLNKSELFKRVTLSRESKKYMPPDNKAALTNVEVDLLKMWIEKGARFNELFLAQNPDENEKYLVNVYLGISILEKSADKLPDVTEIDAQLLEELLADGLMIDFIAENSALIDVSFVNIAPEQAPRILNKLSGIQHNIYKLNMASLNMDDDELAPLTLMNNLHFLRLENNEITGSLLFDLDKLTQLYYLNLNGNPLSENAREALEHLSFIDKIYLWQTRFGGTNSAL